MCTAWRFGLKHAGRLLEPGGRVINMASFVGIIGVPRGAAYATSKAAVVHLTKLGAIELAPRRITVNAISPGTILTPAVTEIPDNPEIPFVDRAHAARAGSGSRRKSPRSRTFSRPTRPPTSPARTSPSTAASPRAGWSTRSRRPPMCRAETGWTMPSGSPELVPLPPGEFTMGESPLDKFANDTERPAHRVRIGPGLSLGRYPVTTGEFRAFHPAHAPGEDPALPVVDVTWHEACAYCGWLAERTGGPFRLPTEAEWEYACRAGSVTPFACGIEITPADANYFYSEAGERIGPGCRTPVGRYPANAFGLHDLHGNVCEWVADPWQPDYTEAPAEGSACLAGDPHQRTIRGGAWDYLPRLLRSSWRDSLPPDRRRDNLGFRVALTFGNDRAG